MISPPDGNVVAAMLDALAAAYGPQHWWPADSPTEVLIGAILTQNTAWTNVEKAINRLKETGAVDFARLHAMPETQLSELIRSAGTFRIKAKRLKAFAAWIMDTHGGNVSAAMTGPLNSLRAELLSIEGIGPETADAMLLYAGNQPSFVVDAYTKRVLRRHGLIDNRATYASVKALMEQNLPRDVRLYNEYHALMVEVGKRHCGSRADCDGCPLEPWPHDPAL